MAEIKGFEKSGLSSKIWRKPDENSVGIGKTSLPEGFQRVKEYWRTDSHYREGDMSYFMKMGILLWKSAVLKRGIGLWGVKKVRPVLSKDTGLTTFRCLLQKTATFFTPPTN